MVKPPKKDIPLAPLERILRKAGARRVSKSAVKEFAQVLSDYTHDLSGEALALAKHAGRKTVTAEDIKLAVK